MLLVIQDVLALKVQLDPLDQPETLDQQDLLVLVDQPDLLVLLVLLVTLEPLAQRE